MPWGEDSVPRRNAHVVWREVEDEIYVCSPDGETMHTLNSVAADIWRAIDGQNTVRDIAELLVAAYEVDPDTLWDDLNEYLDKLYENNLISGIDLG